MVSGRGNMKWFAPGRLGQVAVTHVGRLSKPRVVQIIVQPLYLSRQRHLFEMNIDHGVFLAAQCH